MNHWESIINSLDAIIFSFDKNGIFTSSKGKALELLGLKPDQVVGLSVFDVYKDQPEIVSKCKEALKGNALRYTVNLGDVAFDTSFTPVFNGYGEIQQVTGVSFNVTGRVELEDELQKQKERLNRIIDASNTGIWEWNIVKNELYFSPRWKAMLGYKDNELPNKFETWQNNLHPDDKERMLKNVQDYLENPDGNFEHTFRMKHKNGNYVWILNRSTALLDENGKPAIMSGSHLDITKQIERAEELKKSEKLFRIVFEDSPLGKSLTGIDGTLKVNKAFLQITGYYFEELQQKNWKEITHPDDIEESEKVIQSLIEGKQSSVRFKKRYLHRKGHYIWTEVNTTLNKDENGKPKFFITTISDITERVKSEMELIEVKEKLEAEKALMDSLMENIPDTIYFKDKESRFIRVSASMKDRLGVNTIEEIIGKKDIEFHTKENAKKFVEEEKRIMDTRIPQVNDVFRLKTKFGQNIWVSTTKMPLFDRNGNVVGTFGFTKDITDIKSSEEKFRKLFENDPSAIFIADPITGNIYDANVTAEKMMEMNRDELIGIHQSKLHPKDIAEEQAEKFKTLQENPDSTIDSEIITKSGKRKPVEIKVSTVEINNKIYILGIFHDISQLIEKQEALKQSEEKHRALFESAKDAFVIVNSEGKISEVNPSACKIYGYQYNEMIGMPAINLVHPDRKQVFAKFLNTIQLKGEFNGENIDIRKDGTPFYSEVYGTIINYNNRQQILAVIRDISLRKKREEEIKLKNIVYDSSVAANSISDVNGVLTSVNESFLKIWGYDSADEVIGKPIPNFIKYEEDAVEILKGLTDSGVWQGNYTALKKDGSTFYARASASILQDTNGKLIGYQSSVFDITDVKEAEDKIRNVRIELERSNIELEQFAYISSHDLQEPLRKIKSYTELLEFKYKEQLDEKAGKYLDVITSGTERMQTLIDDLLTYSRVTTKAKEFEKVSLMDVANEVYEILEIPISQNNARVKYSNLPVVMADARQMKQLFQNLVSNALKFKAENNPTIEISATDKKDHWQFKIQDNGIGFEMEYAERIFMAFHRLHNRMEYKGSGIGLAICKKIVQRHGGNIWAESEPGKGATFYFTIPR